jgi:hypothetical protein
MHRLIEKGLMFGNLVRVDSPVLVERYNRALDHLIGRRTEQKVFHIDISGYSPEIGDEFEDQLYLNHQGVNRQFILLTTEQATAPLLHAKLSTSRGILRQFIETNRTALFALTARDAVAGELVNSVYSAESAAKLFDIRKVTVEADTTSGTVAEAQELGGLIDQFKTEATGWYDDVLIARMIGLAKRTGDVIRNPVKLDQMSFGQDNFWADHFGGIYLFRGVAHPAAILAGPKDAVGDLPVAHIFDLSDRSAIAKFLSLNNLVEPIMEARGVDSAAIIRQKMEFIMIAVAADNGEDLSRASSRDMRRLARQYASKMPQEWHGLAALLRWAEDDGPWPTISSEHPAYFYTLRAKAHIDADLINMLLAELSPLDVRQLFICHKEAFYRAYAGWPDEKRSYVVDFLDRAYQIDKAGTRDALFGHQGGLFDMPHVGQSDLIARVGPWGAVTKRRG